MPHVKAIRRFSVRTVLPAPIAALGDLASNLRWSWHPPTRDLFQRIDPQRWDKVRKDPVRLLSALSQQEISDLAGGTQESRNGTSFCCADGACACCEPHHPNPH